MSRSPVLFALAALVLAGCATTTASSDSQVAPSNAGAEPAVAAKAEAPAAAPEPKPNEPAATSPVPFRALPELAPMEVIKLPVANKPIVSFRLLFRAGSVDDPQGKEGLTALTAALLAEGGTQKLTSAELLRALYPMAAELQVSTDKEFTVLAGRVHQDHLDRFLELFTDVLLAPRWDPQEFDRIRTNQLNDVKSRLRNEDDETLGKVALDALMYEGHPYRHYVNGTVAGLSAATLDDAKAHAAKVFTQDRLLIGLAGAVDDALEKKVLERLSALPRTGAPRVTLPPAPGVHGRVLILQKPALSTAISMGSAYGVRRGDPDFFPLYFAMSYLGEHRQSNGVLFTELRERRGLNYGDYAYAENFIQEGWSMAPATNVGRSTQHFSIWIRPVEPTAAVFATRGAQHFLAELVERGIPQDRFETSRRFQDGLTRIWEQSDQRRLGYALDSKVFGTPDFLGSYRSAMKSLTPEQVHAAVQRHFAANKLNYAYVTQDAEGLKKLLSEQPPTPLQYRSPKDAELLAQDAVIAARPLPLDPGSIRIEDAQAFMER